MRIFLTLLVMTCSAFAAAPDDAYRRLLESPEYQRTKLRVTNLTRGEPKGVTGLIEILAQNPTVRAITLHVLLDTRCRRYLPRPDRRACGRAVWEMIKLLDFDVKFLRDQWDGQGPLPPFVFVAFKRQLLQHLNDPRTHDYLTALNAGLEHQERRPQAAYATNLWSSTVQSFGTQAAGVLAILMQDTSAAPVHMEYLARHDSREGRFFAPNLLLLGRALEQLHARREADPAAYARMVYPTDLPQSYNNIYHFYVPWHLAEKLLQRGHAPRFAAIAPFLLGVTYEFITTGADLRYLLADPVTLSSEWKTRDILAGHAGALRGTQRVVPADRGQAALFQQDAGKAVRALLGEL